MQDFMRYIARGFVDVIGSYIYMISLIIKRNYYINSNKLNNFVEIRNYHYFYMHVDSVYMDTNMLANPIYKKYIV